MAQGRQNDQQIFGIELFSVTVAVVPMGGAKAFYAARRMLTNAKILAHELSKAKTLQSNVVTVSPANKIARMIWAIPAHKHKRRQEEGYVNVKPA